MEGGGTKKTWNIKPAWDSKSAMSWAKAHQLSELVVNAGRTCVDLIAIVPETQHWLIAIGYYRSWAGLTKGTAMLCFPDSSQVYRGHGRKIMSGIRTNQIEEKEHKLASTR